MIDILFLLLWWLLFLVSSRISVYYKIFWYGIMIFFLVIIGAVVLHCYYRDAYPLGVIREDIVVRVGPDDTYGTCGIFKAKDKVVICDSRDAWKQVQKIDSSDWYYSVGGVRGWVLQEYVAIDIS